MPTNTSSPRDLLRLHRSYLVGVSESAERITEQLVRAVLPGIRAQFRYADPHDILDALHFAIMDYLVAPDRFDEGRAVSLVTYIRNATVRNVINSLQKERARKLREDRWAREQALHVRVLPTAEQLHDRELIRKQLFGWVQVPISEQDAMTAWLEGEKRVEVLAHLLGISGQPCDVQRLLVKRFKDRMLKRVLRRSGTSDLEGRAIRRALRARDASEGRR